MSLTRMAFAAALPALLVLARPAAAVPTDTVLLQGLDKITARVSTIKVPVGGTVTFGALQITARACDKHPPEETPESAAFLEVVEVKPDEKPVLRFSGWMFASSPALSGLEHPVYDLVVLDCLNQSDDTGALGTDQPSPADAKPVQKPADEPAQAPAGGTTGGTTGGASPNNSPSAPAGSSQ
jgi:hypothetical protein